MSAPDWLDNWASDRKLSRDRDVEAKQVRHEAEDEAKADSFLIHKTA